MRKLSNIIIQSAHNNGISRIKLNEPSTYNALSINTLKSLIKSFKSLNDDEKTKVIVIEGSGKGFCGGHNLKEINSLKRKASSNILESRKKKIDPIFKDQILNPSEGSSVDALKEVTNFEESALMQSRFGRTFIKGWFKKPTKSIWKRLRER